MSKSFLCSVSFPSIAHTLSCLPIFACHACLYPRAALLLDNLCCFMQVADRRSSRFLSQSDSWILLRRSCQFLHITHAPLFLSYQQDRSKHLQKRFNLKSAIYILFLMPSPILKRCIQHHSFPTMPIFGPDPSLVSSIRSLSAIISRTLPHTWVITL
jgi:hypothetical protein